MTFNEEFFDASVRHQIDLLRFGSGVARKVNSLLDATRADLRKQVERRLGKVTGINGASLRRLRELERAIDQQRSGAWNDVTEEWSRVAVDVALEEPMFVAGALTSILPVELDLVQPSPATLRALATTRPFQGKFLKEWADSTSRADLTRIHQQIRIGMVQGESSRDIAARVFGARGAMNVTRAQVDAVTRTVINHVSNAAQQEFLQANSDLFSVEQLVATLDARTTPVCRAEDGKQYPVGKGPIPPLHVACRSIRVGVIDGEVVGERPFKAGTEKQMLREYAAAQGWAGPPKSRDDLPRGHKKSFDAFSRRRMRELTGQVPARTTYQEWLARQPAEIQDDILGPTRAKLFREGGLKLDRFVNREGDEITLEELRQRNRGAWERAGLGGSGADRRIEEQRRREAEEDDRRRQEQAERLRREADEAEQRQRAERERRESAQREEQDRQRQAEEGRRRARERADAQMAKMARTVEFDGPEEWRVPVSDALERAGAGRMREIGLDPMGGLRVVQGEAKPGANGFYRPSTQTVVAGAPLESSMQSEHRTNGQKDSPRGAWSSAYLSPRTADSAAATAVHEFGHHLHFQLRANADFEDRFFESERLIEDTYRRNVLNDRPPGAQGPPTKDPAGKAPTRYARHDYQEFWSESFALYHTDRAWLRREKPESFAMVETVLEKIGLK